MPNFLQSKGTRFTGVAQVISGSAVITQAATTGRTYYVTDVTASSPNATCIVEIQDGSTVLWRSSVEVRGYIEHSFVVPLTATSGNSLTLRAATAHAAWINLGGYYL